MERWRVRRRVSARETRRELHAVRCHEGLGASGKRQAQIRAPDHRHNQGERHQMEPEIGHYALINAYYMHHVQGTLPLDGAARGIPRWMNLARPVAQGMFVFVAIAFGCLTYSFIQNDFSVLYVAMQSNSALPLQYRIAGVWGGHEGSLLLWILMLTGWMLAVSVFSRHLPDEMSARVL